jgi:hypothetical protein
MTSCTGRKKEIELSQKTNFLHPVMKKLEASLEDMNDDLARATSSNTTEERIDSNLAKKCLFPDPGLQKCFQVYEIRLLRAVEDLYNL